MNKSEQVIKYIKSIEAIELPSTSRKYRKFTHPDMGRFYFVGKSGALRVGRSIADSISLTTSVGQLLKRRCIQPKGKQFNDKWEYAGEFRIPKEGEWYVTIDGRARQAMVSKSYAHILTSRKSQLIKVLVESIKHWIDILRLIADEVAITTEHEGTNCPLCNLFRDPVTDIVSCKDCPLNSCIGKWSQFNLNRTFENATAMIEHLQECKNRLQEKN